MLTGILNYKNSQLLFSISGSRLWEQDLSKWVVIFIFWHIQQNIKANSMFTNFYCRNKFSLNFSKLVIPKTIIWPLIHGKKVIQKLRKKIPLFLLLSCHVSCCSWLGYPSLPAHKEPGRRLHLPGYCLFWKEKRKEWEVLYWKKWEA